MSGASTPLHLAAAGLVTSVGDSLEGACAAIRCNLARPAPVEGVAAFDTAEEQEEPVVGHPIAGVTDGFQGLGRWLRLGRLALRDLARHLEPVPAEAWKRMALVVCLPETSTDRWQVPGEAAPEVPSALARELGWRIPGESCLLVQGCEDALFRALQGVGEGLAGRAWDGAVVLAIDSLLDEDSLRWLSASGRLKCSDHPSGLAPGEAAAALFFDQGRGPSRLGTIDALATAAAPASPSPAAAARALEGVLRGALRGREGTVGDVFGNLDGEHDRAFAWGTAQVAIRRLLSADVRETWVATSLGETGVAAPAVALCAAASAFRRGYAKGRRALAFAVSGAGSAGACTLAAAAPRT